MQAVYAAALGVDWESSYDIAHLQAVFSAHEAEEDVTVQAANAAATHHLVHPLSSPPSDALDSDLTDALVKSASALYLLSKRTLRPMT